jgi:uncharacterized phage protein (TIGR02218 family)
MKTVSTNFATHLDGGQTTLAALWKVKRKDGVILGFTSHDLDLTYDAGDGDGAIVYKAMTGLTPSASASKSDLSVDNLEVTAFLDSEEITEEDLRATRYDDADILVLAVNWSDLTMGHMVMRRGTLGIVKIVNGMFTAELRGLTHRLTTQLVDTFGPICRAELGSGLNGIDLNSRWLCLVDMTLYQQNGSLASVTDARTLVPTAGLVKRGSATPAAAAPAGWFNDGLIKFTSGENDGLSFEIKTWDATTLDLFLPLAYPAHAGDTFTIEPGCNKTAGDCKNKFQNIRNFRGEPFIPGMNRFLDVPGGGGGLG